MGPPASALYSGAPWVGSCTVDRPLHLGLNAPGHDADFAGRNSAVCCAQFLLLCRVRVGCGTPTHHPLRVERITAGVHAFGSQYWPQGPRSQSTMALNHILDGTLCRRRGLCLACPVCS